MKKFGKLLALVLVLVMTLALAGCSPAQKIKGEWEAEFMGIELTLEFDGEEVTMSMLDEEETVDYEFDGDTLIIDGDEVDYEFEDSKTLVLDMDELGDVEFEKK